MENVQSTTVSSACKNTRRVKYEGPEINIILTKTPGLEVINLFSMLSSAETKIYPAHKCLNAKTSQDMASIVE